jgi:GNAT superfamily N-acetyltransferase
MIITRAKLKNLDEIAEIGAENFSGLSDIKKAKKWIRCNFLAFPRTQYFVAKVKERTVGYALWIEKGGFRKESVWELEQIAIKKGFQGQGIGTQLIEKSLPEVKKYLKKRGAKLKLIEVTTGTENRVQGLYKKTLGAKSECVVKNFFRGDEVIMIARFK